MKNILFLLIFIPILSFSQVSSWRGSTSQQRMGPSTQQSFSQRNNMSGWRNYSPRELNRPQRNRNNTNIFLGDPWGWDNWGWNRWNMWGAPGFGWNNWSPMWYQNDWGYRQPARVYMYEDGRIDTVRGKKPIINMGIQKSNTNQIGAFFSIGNKTYFIAEYNTTFERNNSTFFPYGKITEVDFPLVNDLIRRYSFYVGVGKRIKRTGIHMMIGNTFEDVKWRGRDDIGYITFPKYFDRFTTVKVGALHDYKNVTIKFDYDPIINNQTFGLGINF